MSKKLLFFILVFGNIFFIKAFSQTGGVTLGANKLPDNSAILDLQSSNKGFLPPRLTSIQRKDIKSPAAGLIVYDISLNKLYLFDGRNWVPLNAGNSSARLLSADSTAAIDSATAGPLGATSYDTTLSKLAVSDGNVWRDASTGCLPSYLKKVTVTRPNGNATAFDPSGNMIVYPANQARNVYDLISGRSLGIAVEAADSNMLYQSDLLTDVNTYNGTKWNNSNVSAALAGTLATRPRFLLTKTDALSYNSYRKTGIRLNYNTPYLIGVLVQRKTCTSFRVVLHSDGANSDGTITLDLQNGDITNEYSASGTFSNARAYPLKSSAGAWLFIFNFTPNSQGTSNTTHQLRFLPNSAISGDALYVAAPFLIQTNKVWSTHIVTDQSLTARGQELLKLDLGLQNTGTVLIKGLMNDQTTRKSRAITWQSSNGAGLSETGAGFTSGYAIAENGILVEAGGKFASEKIISPGNTAYYIDPTAADGGDGSQANPFRSISQLPALNGNLNGTQILFKRGTRIREQLTVAACSNFILDAYGTGSLPIVDASDTIKVPWIQESAAWYLPGQSLGQTIFVNNTRLIGVSTKSQMTTNVNTSWFDVANSRIYINIGASDPNQQLTEITSRTYAVKITSCSNFNVRSLQFQRGRNSGLSIEAADQIQPSRNSLVERCISTYNGAFDVSSGLAGDGFVWYGMNSSSKASGNIIRQCISTYNINCSYEFGFQDSVLVEDNYGSRNGQGIELWGFITNSTFRRNKIMNVIPVGISWGHGNGMWIANSTIEPGITGGHNNNKVYSNVFATTWQESLDIESGTHQFSNNLFFDPVRRRSDTNGSFVLVGTLGGADTINITLKNNIFYNPDYHSYRSSAFIIQNTVSGALLDNNYYYGDPSVSASTPWVYKGTSYGTDFSAYKTATGQDIHSLSQVNPLFVNLASKTVTDVFQTYNTGTTTSNLIITDEALTDFHLSAASTANRGGDSTAIGSVAVDFVPYGTSKAVGPYSTFSGNPVSLGDAWIGSGGFRGGVLEDIQASKGTLTSNAALIQLSLCR